MRHKRVCLKGKIRNRMIKGKIIEREKRERELLLVQYVKWHKTRTNKKIKE